MVCLSISSTFIASTTMLMGAIDQSIQLYVYANLILVFDTFLNAICFMLQFKFNKIIYFKICGSCHFNCYKCMTKTAILEKSVLNEHGLKVGINSDVNTVTATVTTTPITSSREATKSRGGTTDSNINNTEISKSEKRGDKKHNKYNGIHVSLSINSNVSDTEKKKEKEKEKEKEQEKNIGFKSDNGNDSDVAAQSKGSRPMEIEIEIVDHGKE